MDNDYLTVAEVATLRGLARVSIYPHILSGKLPARKYGNTYLIRREDAMALDTGKGGWPRGKRRTPTPPEAGDDEHTARLRALLAAHPELTEIRMDSGYACGQPRIADTRIPVDMVATCYRESEYDLARTQESYDITQEQAEQARMWEQIVREAGDG